MTTDPGRDQNAARLNDLIRLRELLHDRIQGEETIGATLARMSPEDRAETRALLDRLGRMDEPPENTAARQRILMDAAMAENVLLEMLTRTQYKVQGGEVMRDPETGEPVIDETFEPGVRARLRTWRELRSRLTGLPIEDAEPGPDGAP